MMDWIQVPWSAISFKILEVFSKQAEVLPYNKYIPRDCFPFEGAVPFKYLYPLSKQGHPTFISCLTWV